MKRILLRCSECSAARQGLQENMKAGTVLKLCGKKLDASPINVRMRRRTTPRDAAAFRLQRVKQLPQPRFHLTRQSGRIGIEQYSGNLKQRKPGARLCHQQILAVQNSRVLPCKFAVRSRLFNKSKLPMAVARSRILRKKLARCFGG